MTSESVPRKRVSVVFRSGRDAATQKMHDCSRFGEVKYENLQGVKRISKRPYSAAGSGGTF
jgi:hypothetical protein